MQALFISLTAKDGEVVLVGINHIEVCKRLDKKVIKTEVCITGFGGLGVTETVEEIKGHIDAVQAAALDDEAVARERTRA